MWGRFGDILLSKQKCCVPQCQDKYSSRIRFPRDLQKLKQWLVQVNNPLLNTLNPEDIQKTYRVCLRHFPPEYLCSDPRARRGVTWNAKPMLYLPEVSNPENSKETVETLTEEGPSLPKRQKFEMGLMNIPSAGPSTMTDIDLPGPSRQTTDCYKSVKKVGDLCDLSGNVTKTPKKTLLRGNSFTTTGKKKYVSLKDINTTRQKYLSPRKKLMYAKVIESSNKIGRMARKISSFKSKLVAAEKLAASTQFQGLINHVNNLTYKFILSQVRTQKQKPKSRRFTLEEKLLALSLLKASGRGYRLLCKVFSLPSRRTLTNLLNKIPFKAGIHRHIFNTLQKIVSKMKPIDRHAILIFDEMYIADFLQYNSKEDEIDGLEDLGGDKRKGEIADHVNVFMIKGAFRQWKQPICYTFSAGPMKSLPLKNLIKDVIRECHNIGFKILATVCDQGTPNQSAIKSLIKETNEYCVKNGIENKYIGFVVDEEEVIPLFDTPHIFKCIRNNLLTKHLHFTMDEKKGIAKWDHIEQFYYLDTEDQEIRICPKLTDQHIVKQKINKMKVKCVTQVFSHQVGALMKKIISWKSEVNLDAEAIDTANLILFFDKLFDSLNSSRKFSLPGKPLKGAVTAESQHIYFWNDAIQILKSMRYEVLEGENKGKLILIPSINNFILTLKGFIYLSQKVIGLGKNYFLLTRLFQQDALENFFGSIRGFSYRENMPSASHFQSSFKALITNNFMSTHSPGANCEQDESEGPLSNLREFVTGEVHLVIEPNYPQNLTEIQFPTSIIGPGRSKITKCTLTYISGFVLKKIKKNIKCQTCIKRMTSRDQELNLDFIQARQYDKCSLSVPGTFFNFLVSQSICRLFYIIPRLCHLRNISLHLEKNLLKQLQYSLLNCPIHRNTHVRVIKIIIKCCLYFWCRRVNLVAKGKDEKFIKFLAMHPNKNLIDPVKLMAHNRYKARVSRSKAKKKDFSI